jgi:hypothetical protein
MSSPSPSDRQLDGWEIEISEHSVAVNDNESNIFYCCCQKPKSTILKQFLKICANQCSGSGPGFEPYFFDQRFKKIS